jgi:putative Mg2+ transporter-C (MgtC) family protein
MWDTIVSTFVDEFSDLPDAEQLTRLTVRLLLAALLGGLLGLQREHQGKAAGVRTHMLVALGSALFVLVPRPEPRHPGRGGGRRLPVRGQHHQER